MTGDGRPLVALLPLLEHPFDESDLDPVSAVRLVHYAQQTRHRAWAHVKDG